jgi:FdhD protein
LTTLREWTLTPTPADPPVSESMPYAVTETPVSLIVNGQPAACLHCTPVDLEDMALGWLVGEGRLDPAGSVELRVDPGDSPTVKALLKEERPSTGEGLGPGDDCVYRAATGAIPPEERRLPAAMQPLLSEPGRLRPLFNAMFERAELRKAGGGVHTGGLVLEGELARVVEDVGRHNLIDKLIGGAIRAGVDPGRCMLILSARISGAIALKLWRSGVPAVATISVPTTMARDIAARCGITIVGRALKQNPFIYPASV